MYTLHNTFSDVTISRHRTIAAALRAQKRLVRLIRERHGSGSYLPTTILRDGLPLTDSDQEQMYRLGFR